MKKFLSIVVCVCLTVTTLGLLTSCSKAETLNIFNWGQYISDGEDGTRDLIDEFEKETGIKVNYATYDSNESMYARLKSGGNSYDLIIPSDYMAARLIEENMLEKIDYSAIPNYANIDDSFKNLSYDPTNEYTVPYTWGMVGIIYNTKYVTEPVTSWDSLWNEKYKDKILMFSNSRDAFAIGQSLLGIDANTSDKAELDMVSSKLAEQKPLVQEYVMDQIFDKMINETAWIAPYYAGDYLYMNERNENLAFCTPEEGFNRFVDCMCIPKGCTNKSAAEKFINFILKDDVQFANLDYIGYSSTFKHELVPEDYLNDVAYPDENTLRNSFMFEHLPTETLQYIDTLWANVRTAS